MRPALDPAERDAKIAVLNRDTAKPPLPPGEPKAIVAEASDSDDEPCEYTACEAIRRDHGAVVSDSDEDEVTPAVFGTSVGCCLEFSFEPGAADAPAPSPAPPTALYPLFAPWVSEAPAPPLTSSPGDRTEFVIQD